MAKKGCTNCRHIEADVIAGKCYDCLNAKKPHTMWQPQTKKKPSDCYSNG